MARPPRRRKRGPCWLAVWDVLNLICFFAQHIVEAVPNPTSRSVGVRFGGVFGKAFVVQGQKPLVHHAGGPKS